MCGIEWWSFCGILFEFVVLFFEGMCILECYVVFMYRVCDVKGNGCVIFWGVWVWENLRVYEIVWLNCGLMLKLGVVGYVFVVGGDNEDVRGCLGEFYLGIRNRYFVVVSNY